VNLAVHFIRARSSLILSLFLQVVPFLYVTCWNDGEKKENCEWGRGGKGGGSRSVLNNQ